MGQRSEAVGLPELTVLAAAPVEQGVGHLAVASGLTRDAGGDAREGLAAGFRDRVAALDAVGRTLALREACARAIYAVGDGVVNLIEDGAFVRPTRRHGT
jgi:hypothetical protein